MKAIKFFKSMMTECHWWCVSLSYHGMGCVCCSHPTWCVGTHIHVTKLTKLDHMDVTTLFWRHPVT